MYFIRVFQMLAGCIFANIFLINLAMAHGISEADRQLVLEGGNLAYMQLGATHMLTGYDHLLFVFGIIFFLRNFRDIVKYVTAFTVGHSITLIFATFNAIQINYFLIDAIIGLSVCYIAFANIDGFKKFLDVNPPNMMAMITGLGLIHGLGLSSRLQEFPLDEDGLLLNIISFNVGIELGQIFALMLMILAIDTWRRAHSFAKFSIVSNYILILAGILLFLMQMHGYSHSTTPEGFEIVASQPGVGNLTATGFNDSETEWQDTITITIPAQSGKEYKFHVNKGESFSYTWSTNGTVLYYDFHGEPDGNTTGFFESYQESTASQAQGSLSVPFTGIHGWYWQNDTGSPVNVILKAAGDYTRMDLPASPASESVPISTHDTL